MIRFKILIDVRYCGKEHQVADWGNHKKACKHHRLADRPPPSRDERLILNHTFVGDPMDKLTYFVYPKSIDVRLLDTTSLYFRDNFGDFASELDRGTTLTLRGTGNEPYKCVICKTRAAIRGAGFQVIPVTSKDEPTSDKMKVYKALLRSYSEAGAFPAETFEDVWKKLDEQRAGTAHMASLIIPVCDQRACVTATTTLHYRAMKKILMKHRGDFDPKDMFLSTVF
ncbi:hypothetical protein ES702_04615 [subsurface metagenome]